MLLNNPLVSIGVIKDLLLSASFFSPPLPKKLPIKGISEKNPLILSISNISSKNPLILFAKSSNNFIGLNISSSFFNSFCCSGVKSFPKENIEVMLFQSPFTTSITN